ncbi:hypothetical protein EMIHUDRAFT_456311 [Emiliania huxleyi CCMP1516]|uniref:Thioredoxin domain-containing protein n=2 Tax=Emiliania huxleyi TaxID=2903 RepID=A0A0D3K6V3_EMIH1|nr:hypothetical protein EMIHUDRAFT_456311 [Emiliania huxleyi CCMP1516]EOD31488.1 hypothetical protein EMIHUDRAFT_456311 [Emiliania huxleyi CCMP1516]|eukprot:XP_005783917.1 hypothetical protein EMIHUDRAFT_456311 [Emiliania huxleyi CCMP1516]
MYVANPGYDRHLGAMGRKSYGPVLNYFKHVPDDLVVTSTPGLIISALGTVVLITLFLFELSAYLTVTSTTDLVVDELVDETLRVNFNVTLHQVPCEFLSDILKWRLDSNQRVVRDAAAVSAVETRDAKRAADAAMSKEPVSPSYGDEDEEEPPDTDLSQPLSPDTFVPFLQQHELSLVNFYAPWCIWCQRLEPVYLEAAAKVPSLEFHGHTRLAQEFELFTDERSVGAILGFDSYRTSHAVLRKQHAARFEVRRGALSAGRDLYRAKMPIVAANTFCGNNEECIGFTYAAEEMPAKDAKPDPFMPGENPLIYFKSGRAGEAQVNADKQWTSYLKINNATAPVSSSGSLHHGPEGCMVAGHLRVRKVPGVLKLVLHSPEHDHEHALINSSHAVNEFWYGEPLSRFQRSRLSEADRFEIDSPTSHRLESIPFISDAAGDSHVHYLKVVTKVVRRYSARDADTLVYKYTADARKRAVREESTKRTALVEERVIGLSEAPIDRWSSTKDMRGVWTACADGSLCCEQVIGIIEAVLHTATESFLKKQM